MKTSSGSSPPCHSGRLAPCLNFPTSPFQRDKIMSQSNLNISLQLESKSHPVFIRLNESISLEGTMPLVKPKPPLWLFEKCPTQDPLAALPLVHPAAGPAEAALHPITLRLQRASLSTRTRPGPVRTVQGRCIISGWPLAPSGRGTAGCSCSC